MARASYPVSEPLEAILVLAIITHLSPRSHADAKPRGRRSSRVIALIVGNFKNVSMLTHTE